jgi:hypothetical protein
VLEGADASEFAARLQPTPGRCCVRLEAATRG